MRARLHLDLPNPVQPDFPVPMQHYQEGYIRPAFLLSTCDPWPGQVTFASWSLQGLEMARPSKHRPAPLVGAAKHKEVGRLKGLGWHKFGTALVHAGSS